MHNCCLLCCYLQVGLVLPLPEGVHVETVTPDVCLAIASAVNTTELAAADLHLAKAAVQTTSAELQVNLAGEFVGMRCERDVTWCMRWLRARLHSHALILHT